MKKCLIAAVAAGSLLLSACGSAPPVSSAPPPSVVPVSALPAETSTPPASVAPSAETSAAPTASPRLNPDDFLFMNFVNGDKTGLWRLARTSTVAEPVENYAVDYYHDYFKADDEIHFIVNFGLGTTTKVVVLPGMLDVSTYEYVKGEEQDATKIATGMPLTQYWVNLETGEIKDITNE